MSGFALLSLLIIFVPITQQFIPHFIEPKTEDIALQQNNGRAVKKAEDEKPLLKLRIDIPAAFTVIGRLNGTAQEENQRIDLQGADLDLANLQEAELWKTMLQGTRLKSANLQEAKLPGAKLQGTNLSEVENLEAQQIELADGDSTTALPDNIKAPAHWMPASKGLVQK